MEDYMNLANEWIARLEGGAGTWMNDQTADRLAAGYGITRQRQDAYAARSHRLAVAAAELGAEAYRVGPVPDDPGLLSDALEDQLVRADLIVTTGGVSAGAYDTVKAVLSRLGAVEFVRVAMQPGMPQGYGQIGGVPIFTLPGNPVSAYVSFEVFVRPVLRRMLGASEIFRPTVEATVTVPFESPAGKRQFARGQLARAAEGYLFHPSSAQASHQVGVLAHANGLVVVPEGVTSVPAGSRLPVLPLDVDAP